MKMNMKAGERLPAAALAAIGAVSGSDVMAIPSHTGHAALRELHKPVWRNCAIRAAGSFRRRRTGHKQEFRSGEMTGLAIRSRPLSTTIN